jgi:hypothetical protein
LSLYAHLGIFILPTCHRRTVFHTKDQIRPVVFLSRVLPSTEEFASLSQFPAIYFVIGDLTQKQSLIKAGVLGSEKVVIINITSKNIDEDTSDTSEFYDGSAIMISHLINSLFEPIGKRKSIIIELRKNCNNSLLIE